MNCLIISAALLFGACSAQHKLPHYIKACNLKSPDFKKCALENANSAIPHLIKGDKHLGVPILDPIHLPSIGVKHRDFELNFKNANVAGLRNIKLKLLNVDRTIFDVDFQVDNLALTGQYNVFGKILGLNLKGAGFANITAVGGKYKLKSTISQHTKNGLSFLKLGKPELTYTLKRAHFYFDGLLNGDKALNAEINKILNENWQDVLNDLGAPVKDTISAVIQSIVSIILDKVPEQEIFPQ